MHIVNEGHKNGRILCGHENVQANKNRAKYFCILYNFKYDETINKWRNQLLYQINNTTQ